MTDTAHACRVLSLGFIAVLAAAVGGCQSSSRRYTPPDTHTQVKTNTSGPLEGRSTLEMPRNIPGVPVLMLAYALEDVKGLFERDDPFRRGVMGEVAADALSPSSPAAAKVGRVWGQSVRWHNIAFRDLKSGEEWLLLDRRGVVSGYWQLAAQEQAERNVGPMESRGLVFVVTTKDTDGDGALTSADASAALVTDPRGRGARAVTPEGCQVRSVVYDEENRAIYFMITPDTNGDRKFDWSDTPGVYMFRLGQEGPATEVLSEETRRRLDSYLR